MIRRSFTTIVLGALGAAGLSLGMSVAAGQRAPGSPGSQGSISQSAAVLAGQSVTRLPDGRLLLLGGQGPDGPTWTVSLYDPATRTEIALPGRMFDARAWHTATMLPDGTVLVVGGRGAAGEPLSTAERFDPGTETFSQIEMPDALPRAGHTATLLTDGRVVLIGGQTTGNVLAAAAEVWDLASHSPTRVADPGPRTNHVATLLGDGRVLVSGGADLSGRTGDTSELFDPGTTRISVVTPRDVLADGNGLLTVAESLPADGATGVPTDVRIAVRFSHAGQADTITSQTVALSGPEGPVTSRLVPAEDGRLAFVWPASPLAPSTRYTLRLSGIVDAAGAEIVSASTTFTTIRSTGSDTAADPEEWIPDATQVRNGWRTNRPPSPWESLPPLLAAAGATAVSGRVLTLDGRPLPGVTLAIESGARTESDRTGRFLLVVEGATPERRVLRIDGRTAGRPGRQYGFYEYGLSVPSGRTTVLPFTIWMPRLDTRHTVVIPMPTTREVVMTTPYIPGLELHLPPQTTLRGDDGKPVREVSITPVPVDRPPFPLARNVDVSTYFTVQPGGTYVETSGTGPAGAWLVYPNYHGAAAGELAQFFHYDADVKDWYVYGIGRIAADRRQAIPDPGTRFYSFTGAMLSSGSSPPPKAPPPAGCRQKGDPVDVSTGLLIVENTDLSLPDVLPLSLTRTYRPNDPAARPFGIGATHNYAIFLWSAQQYQEADLVLADGGRVHYVRTSPGTGYGDAVFEHRSSLSGFYKSTIRWNGRGWDLTLKDGTVYVFGENAPLQQIRDRYGNTVTVTHANGQTGNITRVTAPNGRSITFSYDASNRIVQVTDNGGRTVGYTYDASGRLWKVADPGGGVTTYSYDSSHRLLTITNRRGVTFVTNQYDANGRVIQQTHADGGVYRFAYTVGGNGNVTQTDVIDPRATTERTTLNGAGDRMTEAVAQGLPEAQVTSWTRDATSNLVLATIDPLNRRTAYTYDAAGNRLTITSLADTAGAVTTTVAYEPLFNQVTSIRDPLGHTTTLTYDTNGNAIEMADGLQHVSRFTYGADGRPVSAANSLGAITTLAYAGGDLIGVTDALGRSSATFVDAIGRVVARRDPSGARYQYVRDPLDRVTQMTDPLGGLARPSYDMDGNLTSLTDAGAHTNVYTYTDMDDRATRTDALQRTEHYEYDLNRNVTRFIDRKGQVSEFRYDALNRRIFAGYGASGGSYQSTIAYTYDAGNRLIRAADSLAGTIDFVYDDLDRLIASTTPQGRVTYTYDADGRRTSLTVAWQPAILYWYDAAERLVAVTRGGTRVSLAYDDANRLTSTVLPNGIVESYGFDAANQLTSITYARDGNVLGDLTYAYDSAGNRIGTGGSWARVSLPAALAAATYDAANRLTKWDARRFTYDPNGNLTSDDKYLYGWNARNQLVAMIGRSSAYFQYDAFGRRTRKTVGGSSVSFLYDGQNPVQELAGFFPSANLVDGLFVDQSFIRSDASGTSSYLIDALGSTIALADTNGVPVASYTYEPFGEPAVDGQASPNAAQFTGREHDATGLYDYRARYYSPATGRFVSEDPVSDPVRLDRVLRLKEDLNSYTYARNNPERWTDPQGTWPLGPSPFIVLQPNGNLWGKFTGQDKECSLGGHFANNRRCVKNCCLGHDKCYDDYRCNDTSWLLNYGSCGVCNASLVRCLFLALPLPPNADPCGCPRF